MKRKRLNTNQIKQRIVISSLVLALIVAGGYLVGELIGKAIETPTPEVIDLDLMGTETINYVSIESINFALTLSGGIIPLEFTFKSTSPNDDGIVSYQVWKNCGDACPDELEIMDGSDLIGGLLDPSHLSSGLIYLDDNDDADLEITLEDGYLRLTNLGYEPPAPAEFKLFDSNMNEQGLDFLFFPLDEPKVFYFNVTSEYTTPVLSATMDGVTLSASEFSTEIVGENFVTGKLDWSTDVPGSHVLDVTATVGAESSTERYIIAIGGIIYKIEEDNFPLITIKRNDDEEYIVRYLFKETTEMQPFSLPCKASGGDFPGVAEIIGKTNVEEFVEKIATHEPGKGVQQWVPLPGVPNDFDQLEPNKGYLIKLKEAGSVEFSAICQENKELLPPSAVSILYSLPDLEVGWNLVGVGGYEPVPIGDLESKVPPFKSITSITLVKQDLDTEEGVQEMEPGKVYWVKVE